MQDWWRSFYDEADYDEHVYLAGEAMPELLARFVERVGVPADLASVGCGPAVTIFEFADRYPAVDCVGYDVSETVVADDREKAADRGLDNLEFAVGALPDLDVDREFDLVYCVATLFFVADAEQAVRSLYDLVRDGGHLVVNYPNRATREAALDFEGRKAEAFSLVRDGENLLTAEAVGDLLDAEPRNYWETVDAETHERPEWPIVHVEK